MTTLADDFLERAEVSKAALDALKEVQELIDIANEIMSATGTSGFFELSMIGRNEFTVTKRLMKGYDADPYSEPSLGGRVINAFGKSAIQLEPLIVDLGLPMHPKKLVDKVKKFIARTTDLKEIEALSNIRQKPKDVQEMLDEIWDNDAAYIQTFEQAKAIVREANKILKASGSDLRFVFYDHNHSIEIELVEDGLDRFSMYGFDCGNLIGFSRDPEDPYLTKEEFLDMVTRFVVYNTPVNDLQKIASTTLGETDLEKSFAEKAIETKPFMQTVNKVEAMITASNTILNASGSNIRFRSYIHGDQIEIELVEDGLDRFSIYGFAAGNMVGFSRDEEDEPMTKERFIQRVTDFITDNSPIENVQKLQSMAKVSQNFDPEREEEIAAASAQFATQDL